MPDCSPITNVGDKRYRASTQCRTCSLSPVMPDSCNRASKVFSLFPVKMDSRLKLAGMTGRAAGRMEEGGGKDGRGRREGRKGEAGGTEGATRMTGEAGLSLCHARRFLSGIQGLFSFPGEDGFPLETCGNDRRGTCGNNRRGDSGKDREGDGQDGRRQEGRRRRAGQGKLRLGPTASGTNGHRLSRVLTPWERLAIS